MAAALPSLLVGSNESGPEAVGDGSERCSRSTKGGSPEEGLLGPELSAGAVCIPDSVGT